MESDYYSTIVDGNEPYHQPLPQQHTYQVAAHHQQQKQSSTSSNAYQGGAAHHHYQQPHQQPPPAPGGRNSLHKDHHQAHHQTPTKSATLVENGHAPPGCGLVSATAQQQQQQLQHLQQLQQQQQFSQQPYSAVELLTDYHHRFQPQPFVDASLAGYPTTITPGPIGALIGDGTHPLPRHFPPAAVAAALQPGYQRIANALSVPDLIGSTHEQQQQTALSNSLFLAGSTRLARSFDGEGGGVGSATALLLDGSDRQLNKSSMLEITIDFTKPDAQRTRPLVAEGGFRVGRVMQRLARSFDGKGGGVGSATALLLDGSDRQLNKSSMLEITIDFTKPDAQRTRPLVAEGGFRVGRVMQRLARSFDGESGGVGSTTALLLDGSDRQLNKSSMLEITIDFTKPDAQRTRPLVAEGRRLYVCDHYMSVWSPVLRASMIECPGRELILPSVKYNSLLETLLCISPIHKRVTEENINEILPIASEYSMDGLIHRCECYLMETRLSLLERLWLADRYRLQRLLIQCLRELRPHSKLDLSGPKYYSLSDRVKVQLLERLQGAQAPEDMPEPPLDADQFQRPNELFFACVRAKNGKAFYVNPYYLAAWSNTIAERLTSTNTAEFTCGATSDELMMLLMTTHPPQLRITEHNIGPILMAGCKLESGGVMRRCADFILSPHTQLTTFARLSLLDRCFLHELLDVCLKGGVQKPEQALDMACQPTYDCLSTKARAAILDRLASLLKKPGLLPHTCARCKHSAPCHLVNWVCPKCGGYCAPGDGKADGQHQQPPGAPSANTAQHVQQKMQ